MSARCHALASTRPRGIPSHRRTSLFPGASSESGDELLFTSVVLHWMEEVDRLEIAGYLGGKEVFDQAIADFSDADKNEHNFGLREEAATASRISVERGL
jgi:hypothetical protein